MADESVRFGLPWILSGQGQKEVTHNEALAIVDMALHPVVETLMLAVPPGDPVIGRAWAVPPDAVGAWAGRRGQIAGWTDGGWRFVLPALGMLAWVVDRGLHAYWTGTTWSTGPFPAAGLACDGLPVVGARQPAIADMAGGTTVDVEARATLISILLALRNHGLIAT
ncbi:DUF2793 domain-containing protein [Sphingomonas montana]|uniref:DUF2793 domain-containing protein n=1 Tax=Sphingomonas montana TaxID=1843236 RepID=UPI00096D14FB|nr:DUF2793 domain-containing protein [Sphingomonas montana]